MKITNSLAALIGLFFVISPWVFAFSDQTGALWYSIIVGIVQIAASLLAIGKSGWGAWQSWLSLVAGVLFIILPLAYSLGSGATWTFIVLGIVTVLINVYSMNLGRSK